VRRPAIIVALVIAVALAFGYARVPSLLRSETEGELPTYRARKSALSKSTVAIGTIKSKVGAEVKVGSRLSGVVAELKVRIGDPVVKGDLLATLQDAEWLARVNVLEAELAAAQAEMRYAESNLQRLEQLRDLVPESQLDDSRRSLKVLQGEVEAAEARLAEAQILLGYTMIRAPVSGTIASVSTNEGETVAASLAAPTFVTIVNLDRLEVHAYVDETDIASIQEGQSVTFLVDAYPGLQFEGVVQAIYPKAEIVNNVVNYVVIIDIIDRKGILIRPEMTTHVNFVLERRDDVIVIPRAALIQEEGRYLVIAREADRWVRKPVEVGLQTPQQIEIRSGLEEGMLIVADRGSWRDQAER
jgi:macrolide-specific efflux system membrane fusion protein